MGMGDAVDPEYGRPNNNAFMHLDSQDRKALIVASSLLLDLRYFERDQDRKWSIWITKMFDYYDKQLVYEGRTISITN